MPRPRKSDDDKKQSFTISISGWLLNWLRGQKHPSQLIESLLLRHKEEMEKKN